jgi:hypothetical protein
MSGDKVGKAGPPAPSRPGDAAKRPDVRRKTEREARETRLAEALRANLRRRKTAPRDKE